MKSAEEILDFWFKPTLRTSLGYDGPTLLGLIVCSMAEQREIDAQIVEAVSNLVLDVGGNDITFGHEWVLKSDVVAAIRAGGS